MEGLEKLVEQMTSFQRTSCTIFCQSPVPFERCASLYHVLPWILITYWLLVEQMLRRWPPWVRILFVGVLWKRTSAAPATLELTLLLTGCCSFGPGGCQGGEVGGWWPGGQVQGPGPQGRRQTRRSPGGSRTHGGHRGCRRRRFHLKRKK